MFSALVSAILANIWPIFGGLLSAGGSVFLESFLTKAHRVRSVLGVARKIHRRLHGGEMSAEQERDAEDEAGRHV